ncbi:hypothetical protein B566_EDAN009080 [Ephemera danica]|nr:hypothetical protein B566_EDAN009080 [Ephemera danica]
MEDYHIVARFQQRQLQEKEQKLLQMLENQQQRALQRVGGRGSAGSSTSSNSSTSSSPASSTGKVRLMFEERRTMHPSSSSPAAPSRRPQARSGPAATTGWDRSYPLDPLAKTSRSIPTAASAARPAARPGVPKPTRTKPDLDVSLRPVRATRDTNANQVLSPNDDLPSMFGKLANVGLRNGANNNFDDDATDTPVAPARKPTVKALAEPKIRPAPAKRVEREMAHHSDLYKRALTQRLASQQPQQTRSPVAPAASRPSPVRRATPPSPARSSNSSSSATTPEPMQKTSRSGSASNSAAPVANQGPLPPGMAECSMCGRRFNEERIGKHEDICRKTKTKKRKVFDPVKMRVQGTEVEAYFKKTGKKPGAAPTLLARKPPSAAAADKKSNWRKKHEEFISSIRDAKKVQQHLAAGGKVSDLPPPKPMDTSDYVQCPHCNRKFAEGAAERHIPRCANIKSNKPAPTRAPPRKR